MKRILIATVLGMVLAGPGLAPADDGEPELRMEPIVVSATGWEQRATDTAAQTTVLEGRDLERRRVPSVAEALREVPGLDVVQSGSRGSTTSLFLRGAESDQVLVLVDGIELNSTTAGLADLANLTLENVERIEVIRGWGGTLHGSEAIGGVVNVVTRRGAGRPTASISAAGGNGPTQRQVGRFQGQTGLLSYSGSLSHFDTDGFQETNDDHRNVGVSGRFDADLLENGTAGLVVRNSSSETGLFFNNNFLAAPDPDARQEDDTLLTRGSWTHEAFPGVRYRLGTSFSRSNVEFRDRPDDAETSSTDSEILSEIVEVDAGTNLSLLDGLTESTFGVEFESRMGDVDSVFSDPSFGSSRSTFDERIDTVSGFTLQEVFLADGAVTLTGGVRVDDDERFGTEVSPSGGVNVRLGTATVLRLTYAEGFKAPSLNELFFPGFGNPDLGAETSWEVSGGIEQSFRNETLRVGTSLFHREVEDLIQGVPNDEGLIVPQNVGRSEAEGVEFWFDARPWPWLRGGGEYTFLDIDGEDATRVRRPKHRGSFHLGVFADSLLRSGDRLALEGRLLVVGDRLDFDPATGFSPARNDGYERVDLTVSWDSPWRIQPVRDLRFFARVENLFDADYQEALGFDARPANVMAGLEVTI